MRITTAVFLGDGRTNAIDADTDIPVGIPWHPRGYALAEAAAAAADLFRSGEDDARGADDFGIVAKSRHREGARWTDTWSGRLYRHGSIIGRFVVSTHYRFD